MKNNETESVIDIDGLTYHLNFIDFTTPMTAYLANYPHICFQPWRLGDYLSVIGLYLQVNADSLTLNIVGFSEQVLLQNHIPVEYHAAYAPLALWWISGGGSSPVLLSNNLYQVGTVQAQLKAWCYADRLTALAQCQQKEDSGLRVDLAAYLTAMLKASVVSLHPAQALEELDSAASCALLSAVLALNIRASADTHAYQQLLSSPQTAAGVLKICRTLSWTPSQVLAAEAVEMDWLMALMQCAEGTTTQASASEQKLARQGLAAYSDAVMIQIEDD
ncbi:MAG: hypothetical protein WAX77_03840 [Methylococcaceae bacterium]